MAKHYLAKLYHASQQAKEFAIWALHSTISYNSMSAVCEFTTWTVINNHRRTDWHSTRVRIWYKSTRSFYTTQSAAVYMAENGERRTGVSISDSQDKGLHCKSKAEYLTSPTNSLTFPKTEDCSTMKQNFISFTGKFCHIWFDCNNFYWKTCKTFFIKNCEKWKKDPNVVRDYNCSLKLLTFQLSNIRELETMPLICLW